MIRYSHSRLCCCFAVVPLNILPCLPDPVSLLPLLVHEDPLTILLPIFPLTIINPSVFPSKLASAFSLIILEISFVQLTICPLQNSLPVHFVTNPIATVSFLVWPVVRPLARDFILQELSLVDTTICKGKRSLPIFLSVLVLSFIASAVRPSFNTLSVLLVFKPVTDVHGPVSMFILAVAVGFVMFPLAGVNVTVGVEKSASAIGLVIFPISFVAATVRPNLNSTTLLSTELSESGVG